MLNKKIKETIDLAPFGPAELIRLDIYSDINILFGSKGTGKTAILEELSKYFNSKGHKTSVYKSNDRHLNDAFDIKGSGLNLNVSDFAIEECMEDIVLVKEATEEEVTSLIKYKQHYSTEETNKIAQRLKIRDIPLADETSPDRQLGAVKATLDKFKEFERYVTDNTVLSEYVEADIVAELSNALSKTISHLAKATEDLYFDSKTIAFLNNIINVINTEISKKTGQPPKPTKTGFATYASNRIKIERAVKRILTNLQKEIEPQIESAGSLGVKGILYCQTNLKIQNGSITDAKYSPVKNVKKNPQKEFVRHITAISKRIYEIDLFAKIAELNSTDGVETITTISDLLLFFKHFVLDGQAYQPSTGESSMILLYKELTTEKDIYLIDEPEKSLGNDYISDVIVPLLKEKALLGKKVVIATHDANIAVRTLPYNSVYRLHDVNVYYTMTGNPFRNTLKCIKSSRTDLDWKEISMKTLEGGKQAFGERGKIYGN